MCCCPCKHHTNMQESQQSLSPANDKASLSVPTPRTTPAAAPALAGFKVFDALKVVAVIMVIVYISSTGRVGDLINCSVRSMIEKHLWLRHVIFIISIFLVRSLVIFKKQYPDSSLKRIWIFTLSVYVLFILATKSKWYFVVAALTLLFLSENLKIADAANEYSSLNSVMFYTAIGLIIVGFVHYLVLQKRERGKKFSLYAFWFGTLDGCASMKGKNKDGKRKQQDDSGFSPNRLLLL